LTSIDGVLLHRDKGIDGSATVIQALELMKIPYTLLTNGGGKHELEKISFVNKALGTNISEDHLVQSHTPFRHFDNLKNSTLLLISQDPGKTRDVFES
jgi:ribonucleotide monophosphatase NagD (HAD superfamily)